MRYVIQLFIIICFSFAGEVLHRVLPFPIPASIYGIILLFLALELKLLKVKQIREVSTTLTISMPVMFVPPAVRLISSWENIRENWLEYIIITFASTFVVMAVAGWTTQRVIQCKKKANERVKTENEDGNA